MNGKGWKITPVEPDDNMLVAGQEAWMRTNDDRPSIEDCAQASAVWAAMMEASPTPPAPSFHRYSLDKKAPGLFKTPLGGYVKYSDVTDWLRAQGLVPAE